MRFDGKLKSWNDERGFGFIEPASGGQDIFVHIKAFPRGAARPAIDAPLSFEVELGPQGRKRATRIQLERGRRPLRVAQQAPAPRGASTLLVLPVFLAVFVAVYLSWRPPGWIAGIYVVLSMATFAAYAIDKAAARRGDRRISEGTLHLFALIGGWPGALVAQQLIKHKSRKAAFRQVFWWTVLLNVGALLLACSPFGRQYWALR